MKMNVTLTGDTIGSVMAISIIVFFMVILTFFVIPGISTNTSKATNKWKVTTVKYNGPVQTFEEGWEPFGYDKDTSTIYLKRKCIEE